MPPPWDGAFPYAERALGKLKTADAELLTHALTRYDLGDREPSHILLPVCPEHAVEVYRGRVPGVEMAWQVA